MSWKDTSGIFTIFASLQSLHNEIKRWPDPHFDTLNFSLSEVSKFLTKSLGTLWSLQGTKLFAVVFNKVSHRLDKIDVESR